jgi:hypothetical protein
LNYLVLLCVEVTFDITQYIPFTSSPLQLQINCLHIGDGRTGLSVGCNTIYFENSITDISTGLKKWFKVSKLTLYFHKTNFMKFTEQLSISIRTSEDVLTNNFLGLQNKIISQGGNSTLNTLSPN